MRHNRPSASAGDAGPSRRRLLLGAGSLLALAGCNSFLVDRPPPQLFRLSPKSTYPEDLPTVPWQLVLEAPAADAGVNSQRIALVRRANQIEYYARANWTDRAPAMFQTMMIESFENSHRIVSVGRESLGLRADFVLKSELREFQAVYDGPGAPSVRVGLAVKLVAMPRREIIAATDIEHISAAAADTLEDVVDAFDTASGHVLKKLVIWVLTAGERHWLKEHPAGEKS